MPKFRLRSDHPPVSLFLPDRLGGESYPVEPGSIVDVPGELAVHVEPKEGEQEAPPLPDDAYVVGKGSEARAWPKSTWELVPAKPAAPAAPAVKEK
jgi:hypothetical protein